MTISDAVVDVHTADAYPQEAADTIGAAITERVRLSGTCTLFLVGGSTPAPVYAALTTCAAIPWSGVSVYFGDERAVAPTHPRSNYRMACKWLLDHLPEPPREVHRLRGERPDLESAAAEYEALLPERADVLLLGIGVDGHVASLFPDSPALDETSRRIVPARAPLSGERRLTITPPVIESAAATFMLARGVLKARAVRDALAPATDVRACPAKLAAHATWILDTDAASKLALRGAEDDS